MSETGTTTTTAMTSTVGKRQPDVPSNDSQVQQPQGADFGAQLMTACWLGKTAIDAFLAAQGSGEDMEQLQDKMRRHFPKASCH